MLKNCMPSEKVETQRRTIIASLEGLIPLAESLEPVLSCEKHNKLGCTQRSLDPKGKKGYLIHMKRGGFDAQYIDENGNRYVFKFYPIRDR
jgi:hypothetical protein